MNIKKVNSISLNPADANRTYSAYDTIYVKDNQWFINDAPTGKTITDIEPRKQFKFYADCQNIEQVNSQMAIFDQQLNTLQKEINYWDIYRIKAQVTNSDSVEAVYALLRPGESLVINTDTEIQYYDNDKTAWTLKRGDVIIKTLDSTAIIVKALAQGIYYPAQITKKNGSYSILYQFSTVIPEETKTVEKDINTTEKPIPPIPPADLSQNLIFNSLSDDVKTQPYNLKLSSDNLVFPIITVADGTNNVVISPCIKFYTTSNNEEIYLDFTLTTQDNNWVITPSVNLPANFYYVLVK